VKISLSTPRGERSGVTPMINWGDFKTQWVRFWRRFCSKVKTKPPKEKPRPAKKKVPSTIKPLQIYSPAILFYFIERGRRSYEKGISFTHWSDRMIIVHGGAVIPYLREAWEHVKAGTFPTVTDVGQNGANHVKDGNVIKKPTGMRSASLGKFLTRFDWRSFVGGFVICLFLCLGFFYALGQRYKVMSTPVAATRNSGFAGFQGFRGFGQTSAPVHSQTMRIDTWTGRAWIYNDSTCTWQPITESK
jgi:hypothetical protein